MIRKSGVTPATAPSKAARLTPRCAAKGHKLSIQLPKLAAAARIASAVISGCPDDPDSPLHSGAGVAAGAVGPGEGDCTGVTIVAGGLIDPVAPPNSERKRSPTD